MSDERLYRQYTCGFCLEEVPAGTDHSACKAAVGRSPRLEMPIRDAMDFSELQRENAALRAEVAKLTDEVKRTKDTNQWYADDAEKYQAHIAKLRGELEAARAEIAERRRNEL